MGSAVYFYGDGRSGANARLVVQQTGTVSGSSPYAIITAQWQIRGKAGSPSGRTLSYGFLNLTAVDPSYSYKQYSKSTSGGSDDWYTVGDKMTFNLWYTSSSTRSITILGQANVYPNEDPENVDMYTTFATTGGSSTFTTDPKPSPGPTPTTTYTITYNANGGTGAPSPQTKTKGVDIYLSTTVPTREGYTFVQWNTKPDGSGWFMQPGWRHNADENITFYAIWAESYSATTPTLNKTSVALGGSVTITTTNAESSARHKLTYAIGGVTGDIASSVASSYTWTVPTSFSSYLSGDSATCTITCETTIDNRVIGSKSVNITVTIPSYTYVFGANPTAARGSDSYPNITEYVNGKTNVKFTLPAQNNWPTPQYGTTAVSTATITKGSSVIKKVDNVTPGQVITVTPNVTGTVRCTVNFKDSRGEEASAYVEVSYVAANAPTISQFVAYRTATSTSTTQTVDGAYYYAKVTARYYGGYHHNSATLTLTGASDKSSTESGDTAWVSVTQEVHGSLAAASRKVVTTTITDYLGQKATSTITIPQAYTPFQVGGGDNGRGVSIGKAATLTGPDSFEVGLPTVYDEAVGALNSKVRYFDYYEIPTADRTNIVTRVESLLKHLCAVYTSQTTMYTRYIGRVYDGYQSFVMVSIGDVTAVDSTTGLPSYAYGIYQRNSDGAIYEIGCRSSGAWANQLNGNAPTPSTPEIECYGTPMNGCVRFLATNTQFAWKRFSYTGTVSNAWGSGYASDAVSVGDWTKAFNTTYYPLVTTSVYETGGDGNATAWLASLNRPTATSAGTWEIERQTAKTDSTTWQVCVMAIGGFT